MTEPLSTKGRLIGKILIDWCMQKQNEHPDIHFKKSLCSGLQNIRFTSELIQSVFPHNESEDGYILCYEIQNLRENVSISVTLNPSHLGKRLHKLCSQLMDSLHISDSQDHIIRLKTWNVSDEAENLSQIQTVLDQIFDYELSYFETELKAWLTDHSRKIKDFPQCDQLLISNQDLPHEILMEGAMKEILSNPYERNLKARSRCIAHYGTSCQICGFDFGAVYGEAFAGKIEVHHRKPLCEIKENYIVDPIQDLVPVCPNCHLILHSKKDGVYTVDDVKKMLNLICKES